MFSTVCSIHWPEIADRIWTYPVVALTLTLFAGEMNWILFPAVGAFLAADMAVQIAGDDVRWGTFEFLFTRPVDRGRYFSTKFLFGLAPLAGLAALYAVFSAVDLKNVFWNLVMEPVGEKALVPNPGAGLFVIEAAALFVDYTVVFFLCTTSTKESSFPGFISLGFILTGIYTVLCAFLMSRFFPSAAETGLSGEEAFRAMTRAPLFLVPALALLLAPAAALFLLGRAYYSRCELPSGVQSENDVHRAGWNWIAWLVFFLLGLLVVAGILLLSVSKTSP